jgi:hypothetical protein
MIAVLSQYLDNIRDNLRLDVVSEKEVIDELQTHIEEEVQEMREAGLSEEEAASTCIKSLGSAKMVARRMYEAHSQGTWRQALLASTPHLLLATLFVLNWWQGVAYLIILLSLILGTAIYGWLHGNPLWLFPWLGYSLMPVVVAGLSLLYLPRGWSWLAIVIYLPLAFVIVYFITIKTIKRDWLYSSLMLLPVPVIIGWFLTVGKEDEFLEFRFEYIQYFAPWIGLTFLSLAATVIAFIRLRQRWIKIVLLPLSGFLTLLMVAYYAEGKLNLPAFIVLILIMFGLMLSPALMERRIRRSRQQPIATNIT